MASPPSSRSVPAIGGAVGFLVVMEFGSGLLQGWFSPLLARIGTDFGVDAASLNWVSALYLLMTVAFVPIIGKLGDLYGHKRLLLFTVALVAVGSFVVALAPNFTVLLIGRALQAPLGAFLPLEFAIVRSRNPEASGRSIGKLVGALTIGGALGAMVSGILLAMVDNLTLVLLVPAVFMALCIPIVAWLVPESDTRTLGRVDWPGAALLTAGLLLALAGISNARTWGWGSLATIGCIVVGAALLAVWVQVERRVQHPLVDLTVLRSSGIGLPIVAGGLFGAQMFGSQTAGSLFIMNNPETYGFGLGLSSSVVGVVFLVLALCTFVGTVLADRLVARSGVKSVIVFGALLGAASFVGMIVASAAAVPFLVCMAIGSFGNGLLMGALPGVVVRRAPEDSVAVASALYNTTRTAGGSVSGAVFALVMASFLTTVTVQGTSTTVSSSTSYAVVWGLCAALCIGVALFALRFRAAPPAAAGEGSEHSVSGEALQENKA